MRNRALNPDFAEAGGNAGGLSSRERTRMLVFFVFAAVVTGTFLFTMDGARRTEEPQPAPRAGEGEIGDVGVDVAVTPWTPPLDVIEGLVHEKSELQRARVYPKPRTALALYLRNHLTTHILKDPALSAVGGFQVITDARPLADPENAPRFRARPIEMIGKIVVHQRVSPEEASIENAAFKLPLERGILDVDGQLVQYLMATDGRYVTRVRGERVKVRGAFYRVIDIPKDWAEDPDERNRFITVPLVLGKDLLEPIDLPLLSELPPSFREDFLNMGPDDIKTPPQEDPKFRTLLGWMIANGEKVLEGHEPTLLRGKESLERPDKYYLERVRVRGQIIDLNWESFDRAGMREGDAPILGYWYAVVADPMPEVNAPALVVLPWKELPEGIRKHASVDIPGVYFRVHAFKNQKGAWINFPMVVAAAPPAIRKMVRDTRSERFLVAFVGAGVILVLALVIMLARDRRQSRALDGQIREKRITRRKSRGFDLNRVARDARAGEDGDPT